MSQALLFISDDYVKPNSCYEVLLIERVEEHVQTHSDEFQQGVK
jgi:hypothetical protein